MTLMKTVCSFIVGIGSDGESTSQWYHISTFVFTPSRNQTTRYNTNLPHFLFYWMTRTSGTLWVRHLMMDPPRDSVDATLDDGPPGTLWVRHLIMDPTGTLWVRHLMMDPQGLCGCDTWWWTPPGTRWVRHLMMDLPHVNENPNTYTWINIMIHQSKYTFSLLCFTETKQLFVYPFTR